MSKLGLLLAVLMVPASGWSLKFTVKETGRTSAGFLKLGAGARSVAMGEASAAAVEDATAMYWNPASLTRVEKRSAALMHASYLDSSYFEYGAFALRSRFGTFGTSFQYFSMGKITETSDVTGADLGDFSPHDMAFSFGYAYDLGGYSLGLAAKFIQSKIIGKDETGAVDFGFLSPALADGKLRLALAATNIGGSLRFEKDSFPIPAAIRAGGAYRLTPRWLAALDVVAPNDNDPYVALGTEYVLPLKGGFSASGRLGFKSLEVGGIDGFIGPSFGVGLTQSAGLTLDYALVPFGGLGLTHRVSLSLKF